MSEESYMVCDVIGENLSAVRFVHDYVEFHFDEKIIRVLTGPSLKVGDKICTFPEPGSRDAFCSLIGKAVARLEVKAEESAELSFATGEKVTIPLSERERIGPEAMQHVPGENQPIEVW